MRIRTITGLALAGAAYAQLPGIVAHQRGLDSATGAARRSGGD